MRKYIYFIIVLLIGILLKFTNQSFAYQECSYITKQLNGINSKNIMKYFTDKNITYHKFCSYQDCYNMKNNNIDEAINNFMKLQKKRKSEEYNIEAYIKGIPITEISFTLCE
ncbi:MAG: hypothetical protein PHH51_02735 [Bacilli bacterium]|nr:hypothetical protein [Bacilli bacterium]MDD3895561.1 hypothetical protein [Bacilli bacterium]MDD4407544.1 hypothetical protein [Bacilli bacterium]